MVILFRSDVVSPPALIYMGVDKHENEELIRWGWPEDVWFHVDKLSSAHVYLRLKPGETLEDIPGPLIEDLAQLVKANSIQRIRTWYPGYHVKRAYVMYMVVIRIMAQVYDDFDWLKSPLEGNKANDVDVVYCMWDNLQKTGDMDVGQIGFKKQKAVNKVRVEKRINEIVNRLNKTREDKEIDYRQLREERDRRESENKKQLLKAQKKVQEEEALKRDEEKRLRSYDGLFTEDRMQSNRTKPAATDGNESDDFM